ncbi:GIY-YIG nuclease family protein [Methylobacterium sp. UNC378MF]|uniref:GIY-YIG nuclease family protein n=1 Tax=Methylobacterium sp. UNC378MF TaxID=1502748 RepID=UPI000B803EDE|nr:GIY-YIG nuclease family protein [Methylobacterium sp. UNC378MF]
MIRYRDTVVSTGCAEHELAKAEEMLAAFDETRRRVKRRRHRYPTGHIYFISRPDDPSYPVKVGYTGASLYMRVANVQVGNPHRLDVIASCEAHYTTELKLHLRLGEGRLLGEWFARSELLQEAMSAAKGGRLEEWLGIVSMPPDPPAPVIEKRPARGTERVLAAASRRPTSAKRPYRPAAAVDTPTGAR